MSDILIVQKPMPGELIRRLRISGKDSKMVHFIIEEQDSEDFMNERARVTLPIDVLLAAVRMYERRA